MKHHEQFDEVDFGHCVRLSGGGQGTFTVQDLMAAFALKRTQTLHRLQQLLNSDAVRLAGYGAHNEKLYQIDWFALEYLHPRVHSLAQAEIRNRRSEET